MRQCCLQRTICGKIYSCILLCVKIPIVTANFCCRPDFLRTPLLIGILTSCSPDKSELLSLDQYTQEDSCTLVWAEWVRAHGGWRKDGFGRELDPQNCTTTGKFIPVCGLTELAGDFSDFPLNPPLTIRPVTCMYVLVASYH